MNGRLDPASVCRICRRAYSFASARYLWAGNAGPTVTVAPSVTTFWTFLNSLTANTRTASKPNSLYHMI